MSYLIKGNPKNVNFIHVYSTTGYTFTSPSAPITPTNFEFSFNSLNKSSQSSLSTSNGKVVLDNKKYNVFLPLAGIFSYYNSTGGHNNLVQKYVLYKNGVEIENQVYANNYNLLANNLWGNIAGAATILNTSNDVGFASFEANAGDLLSLTIFLDTTATTVYASYPCTIIFAGSNLQNTNFAYPLFSLFIWEVDK